VQLGCHIPEAATSAGWQGRGGGGLFRCERKCPETDNGKGCVGIFRVRYRKLG